MKFLRALTARSRTVLQLFAAVAYLAIAALAVVHVLTSSNLALVVAGVLIGPVASTVMLVGFIRETEKLRTGLDLANEAVKLARDREQQLAQERSQRPRYDALTGLANRTQIEEHLGHIASARHPGSAFTVVFVNLDRFKNVNDDFGRRAADLVLVEVASRLTAAAGREATVARYSGDEFVMFLPSVSCVESIASLTDALRQKISAPIVLPDGTVRITASIGMAIFPYDGTSVENVLESADAAARHAKRSGGNKTQFFSRDLIEQARSHRRLQDELNVALQQDQFVLHYQPIVELKTGTVVKAEALIRWQHPARGIVGPCEFIPIAEQSGLIEHIGYWVIEEVVRQAAAWDAKGTPIRIAVNVSARQLDDHGFLPHLTRTLARAKIPSDRLELEITETAAMKDASAVEDVLERCRALGVSISLDDFGTYYSSLTYLKRLPVDNVKIDKSFVQGLPFVKSDAAIVAGILGLVRGLDRTAIAEGIENDAQRDWLLRAGCEFGQGYFFGRPMSAAEICRHDCGAPIVESNDAVAF